MPLYTKRYSLPYPVPSDKADPPRDMKALAERIELVFGTAYPIGTILPFGGFELPNYWAWCDGTAHNSDALLAVTGSNLTPNLSGKFPVGAGTKYAVGATGGAASVTLTSAQVMVGAHTHSVTLTISNTTHTHNWNGVRVLTGYVNQDHGHVADPGNAWMGSGGHEHGVVIREGYDPQEGNDGNYVDSKPTPQDPPKQVGYTNGGGGHEHVLDIGAFWTSGKNTNHQHTFNSPLRTSGGPTTLPGVSGSVGNSTAVAPSTSHENRPNYRATRFIIKTGVLATAPIAQTVATTTNANGSLTSVTVAAPTGAVEGDYIVLFLHTQASSIGATPAVPGWRFLYTCTSGTCGGAVRWTQVYGRVHTDADPGPWVIPLPVEHQTQRKVATAVAVRNVVFPPSQIGGLIDSPIGTEVTIPVSSATLDRLVLASWHSVTASPNRGTLVSTSADLLSSIAYPVADGSASADTQHVISKRVPANTATSLTMQTQGPTYAAEVALAFGFDQPAQYGPVVRYTSVTDMIAKAPFYWAHRGGSENWPEMSELAYDSAIKWGAPALELSLSRTSDGVWFGLHDQTINRTSPSAPANSDPTAMTWAQVNSYLSYTENGVAPYLRLSTFLSNYANTGRILVIDPKYQATTGLVNELLDQVLAVWPAERVIFKSFITGVPGPVAATARGVKTWGYLYETDIAGLGTHAPRFDLLGYDIGASAGSWAQVIAVGKPVVAHILNTQAQKTLALSYGAVGMQCSNVLKVIPRGAA